MTSREVVGVLGGTFDPVHNGHLAIAERVRRALGLTRMLMVLTRHPPHKTGQRLTPFDQRAAMLDLAIAGRAGLERSPLESGERVAYTVDTLRSLRSGDPPVDPVFVLGSDALLDLPYWHEAPLLVTDFDLCVHARPAATPRTLARLPAFVRRRIVELDLAGGVARDLERLAPGRGGRVFLLADEPVDVSSSRVRAVASRGGDLAALVPEAVAGYILATGLYSGPERED
jgi:nicotinate-nucleotide adenylyltransferase